MAFSPWYKKERCKFDTFAIINELTEKTAQRQSQEINISSCDRFLEEVNLFACESGLNLVDINNDKKYTLHVKNLSPLDETNFISFAGIIQGLKDSV